MKKEVPVFVPVSLNVKYKAGKSKKKKKSVVPDIVYRCTGPEDDDETIWVSQQ